MNIETILDERKKTHGDFADHARITQNIKAMICNEPNYGKLSAMQREGLEMIAHKIGRILAGNPDHHDHWDDISGYARIVSERLP